MRTGDRRGLRAARRGMGRAARETALPAGEDEDVPTVADVRRAVLRQAVGYRMVVRKHVKVKRVEYDENGRKVAEVEEMQPVDDEVYVAPSVTAAMYCVKLHEGEVAAGDVEERVMETMRRVFGANMRVPEDA